MKVFTDVNGGYVIRRGDSFTVTARIGEISVESCTLSSAKDVEEFTEALAGAARDASRLTGKPKYRPAVTRRPKDGWPIAMEVKG
jgi:hypothetical protein